MNEILFSKMAASGNDFVVVDNRRKIIRNAKFFAQKICRRHFSVGADGVLLLEKSKKAAFRMRILNADGSEAEACGNGFRCVSLFAHRKLRYPKRFKFESLAGVIEARMKGERICVELPDPSHLKRDRKLRVLGRSFAYDFVNTGVPHVVVLVRHVNGVDVERFGRAIRYHRHFKSKGANVNFVQPVGRHRLRVRTYERGVEAETLACGTGSTASAVIGGLKGIVSSPVQIQTRGGEILTIRYQCSTRGISNVSLEGEANFVYEGVFQF
ncbi:MAG: diaminopimelate epimerase [Candidatus Omnitrophica bacterium]|nr:diaminopimelate epimerase [Candidatus Omnitrophota bacterium]